MSDYSSIVSSQIKIILTDRLFASLYFSIFQVVNHFQHLDISHSLTLSIFLSPSLSLSLSLSVSLSLSLVSVHPQWKTNKTRSKENDELGWIDQRRRSIFEPKELPFRGMGEPSMGKNDFHTFEPSSIREFTSRAIIYIFGISVAAHQMVPTPLRWSR